MLIIYKTSVLIYWYFEGGRPVWLEVDSNFQSIDTVHSPTKYLLRISSLDFVSATQGHNKTTAGKWSCYSNKKGR